ncbi:hypothetical protein QQF64_003028 [Cirrhinus molitorella]|uniref:Uncharacterized protein n=1 Tax=Cirrhinus molitorella TaxID=172907 RepID=A0ABR3MKA5_9TELE
MPQYISQVLCQPERTSIFDHHDDVLCTFAGVVLLEPESGRPNRTHPLIKASSGAASPQSARETLANDS